MATPLMDFTRNFAGFERDPVGFMALEERRRQFDANAAHRAQSQQAQAQAQRSKQMIDYGMQIVTKAKQGSPAQALGIKLLSDNGFAPEQIAQTLSQGLGRVDKSNTNQLREVGGTLLSVSPDGAVTELYKSSKDDAPAYWERAMREAGGDKDLALKNIQAEGIKRQTLTDAQIQGKRTEAMFASQAEAAAAQAALPKVEKVEEPGFVSQFVDTIGGLFSDDDDKPARPADTTQAKALIPAGTGDPDTAAEQGATHTTKLGTEEALKLIERRMQSGKLTKRSAQLLLRDLNINPAESNAYFGWSDK